MNAAPHLNGALAYPAALAVSVLCIGAAALGKRVQRAALRRCAKRHGRHS